jgi:hypothetical protein
MVPELAVTLGHLTLAQERVIRRGHEIPPMREVRYALFGGKHQNSIEMVG